MAPSTGYKKTLGKGKKNQFMDSISFQRGRDVVSLLQNSKYGGILNINGCIKEVVVNVTCGEKQLLILTFLCAIKILGIRNDPILSFGHLEVSFWINISRKGVPEASVLTGQNLKKENHFF